MNQCVQYIRQNDRDENIVIRRAGCWRRAGENGMAGTIERSIIRHWQYGVIGQPRYGARRATPVAAYVNCRHYATREASLFTMSHRLRTLREEYATPYILREDECDDDSVALFTRCHHEIEDDRLLSRTSHLAQKKIESYVVWSSPRYHAIDGDIRLAVVWYAGVTGGYTRAIGSIGCYMTRGYDEHYYV